MHPKTAETIRSWQKMPHDHVFVDEDKLMRDAVESASIGIALPRWDVPGVHPKNNQAFVYHNFWWNTVNFAFSLFDGLNPDGSMKKFQTKTVTGADMPGAFAMKACFYRAFGEQKIFARDMLPHVKSLATLREFFRGHNEIPMLQERLGLLRETCEVLEGLYSGDPWNIWEEGGFSAYGSSRERGIVDILKQEFPATFGSDVVYWRHPQTGEDLVFHFDKRVHLAVLIYHDRAEYSNGELPLICDIHELGAVPDYELPRSYAADGAFKFSDVLSEAIRLGIHIKPKSQMELEYRGATVFAQELELEAENAELARLGFPPRHIGHRDYYRWSRGKKVKSNHPLCPTTAY